MLDNYAALLCLAFIHAEIVDSLCFLGTHGEFNVAMKSRKLLVSIMLVVAKIFPDRTCSDLLTVPSLVELSAMISPGIKSVRTHAFKAAQILVALADAFTMAPYEINNTHSLNLARYRHYLLHNASAHGGGSRGLKDLREQELSTRIRSSTATSLHGALTTIRRSSQSALALNVNISGSMHEGGRGDQSRPISTGYNSAGYNSVSQYGNLMSKGVSAKSIITNISDHMDNNSSHIQNVSMVEINGSNIRTVRDLMEELRSYTRSYSNGAMGSSRGAGESC